MNRSMKHYGNLGYEESSYTLMMDVAAVIVVYRF